MDFERCRCISQQGRLKFISEGGAFEETSNSARGDEIGAICRRVGTRRSYVRCALHRAGDVCGVASLPRLDLRRAHWPASLIVGCGDGSCSVAGAPDSNADRCVLRVEIDRHAAENIARHGACWSHDAPPLFRRRADAGRRPFPLYARRGVDGARTRSLCRGADGPHGWIGNLGPTCGCRGRPGRNLADQFPGTPHDLSRHCATVVRAGAPDQALEHRRAAHCHAALRDHYGAAVLATARDSVATASSGCSRMV